MFYAAKLPQPSSDKPPFARSNSLIKSFFILLEQKLVLKEHQNTKQMVKANCFAEAMVKWRKKQLKKGNQNQKLIRVSVQKQKSDLNLPFADSLKIFCDRFRSICRHLTKRRYSPYTDQHLIYLDWLPWGRIMKLIFASFGLLHARLFCYMFDSFDEFS